MLLFGDDRRAGLSSIPASEGEELEASEGRTERPR
jgi:hypothetical protein